jgi:predicted nucleic acid-binding protein
MPINPNQNLACLLDSDVVIDFLRRREYARRLLERWAEKGRLAVCTLTHLEIYQGIKKGEEENTHAFLEGLASISLDVPIAQRAGSLLGELRKKGTTISVGDAIIAATALTLKTPLLTNNIHHYPFTELEVVKGQ